MSDIIIVSNEARTSARKQPFVHRNRLSVFLTARPICVRTPADIADTVDAPPTRLHSLECTALQRSMILVGLTSALLAVVVSASLLSPRIVPALSIFAVLHNAVDRR